MDSVTHTLFGLALYGTIDKSEMDSNTKRAYFITTVGASLIPDVDVISKFWDTEGLYQMWHRGITHSVFLTPVWALLFSLIALVFFRVKDIRLFFIGWLAVFIHDTSDLFNAWGTGYFEPFSSIRITFGTIPIVDFVFWAILGVAYLFSQKKKEKSPFYFKMAWVLILVHVVVQTTQGYFIHKEYQKNFTQVALSADFIPWNFSVITKEDNEVKIFRDSLFLQPKELYALTSSESTDLEQLFSEKPEAKTLVEWSPFIVIVEDDEKIGVYDPRFYRNGQSFLFEYMEVN